MWMFSCHCIVVINFLFANHEESNIEKKIRDLGLLKMGIKKIIKKERS